MTIFLGADHAGFDIKTALQLHLHRINQPVVDCGAVSLDEDDDYPKYAYTVASKILGASDDDLGVLVCGSGQGMSMAANRVNGVRAALAWSPDSARSARADDNANVLVLPSRFITVDEAIEMLTIFINTEFKADPKYQRRLDELEQLYG